MEHLGSQMVRGLCEYRHFDSCRRPLLHIVPFSLPHPLLTLSQKQKGMQRHVTEGPFKEPVNALFSWRIQFPFNGNLETTWWIHTAWWVGSRTTTFFFSLGTH